MAFESEIKSAQDLDEVISKNLPQLEPEVVAGLRQNIMASQWLHDRESHAVAQAQPWRYRS